MKKEQTTWRGKILKTVERHCEGKLTPAELSFLYNTLETQFSQEKEKWVADKINTIKNEGHWITEWKRKALSVDEVINLLLNK